MNEEQEDVRYNEAVSDFASLIIEYGPRTVMLDLMKYFPDQYAALHASMTKPQPQVAALFKPDSAALFKKEI